MNSTTLPDITSNSQPITLTTLQWVGMENIAVPMKIKHLDQSISNISTAVNVYVNLADPTAKGIHMSRLHLLLNQLEEKQISKERLESLLSKFVESQDRKSQNSKIEISFDLILKKPSLLTNNWGFQSYPIKIHGEKRSNKYLFGFELCIPYSSTCPCSASLSRDILKKEIQKKFTSERIDRKEFLEWFETKNTLFATPHGQRSFVKLTLDIAQNTWPDIPTLIFQLEGAIGTPTQTVVKRKDEQEFAMLNAENLMFCEDAARIVKKSLSQMPFLDSYSFKVEHQESLHNHNAVVIEHSAQ
ncbi:GTP cyclohydrolase FolE2 [Pleionea sediminis]|uniref:GTP cyclohydrolase FolE2 n=1 Tax=Pleionea sediminis TaxID=2569479 RepID=UPI0011849EBF|nr:GTP cyclohydrolase FolE2 [Pleionea sediminis]